MNPGQVRVISWIVRLSRRTKTIHEVTRTNTKPEYFRLELDVTFVAKTSLVLRPYPV